jgi:hypothetical protein
MYRTIYSEKEDLSEACFAAIVDWFYSVGDFDCVAVRGDALLWCGEHSVCGCGAGAV